MSDCEHHNLEKMASTAPMLPRDAEDKVVIISPKKGSVGKILIREDTILANLQGCAGCGRAPFSCGGVSKQWSALCWGKDRKNYCLLITLSSIFVLSIIGTILLCFTNTLNDAILSNMVIRNNSLAYKMWQRPTVRPLMKVHIFNYTNWREVKSGDEKRLRVVDVGPFVYQQRVERVNVKFADDRVSYQERNTFAFLPELSAAPEYERLAVPNLPLLGVISMAISNNLATIPQVSLNSILSFVNHPDAFNHLPVRRFLWGYDDDIIDGAKPFLSFLGQMKFQKFGLLVTKNGTVDDRFTINTGIRDKDRMNIVEKLDGNTRLPYWSDPQCSSLEGTDGSMFPPSLLDRRSPLYVLFPNLCRRLPFRYVEDVVTPDGVALLRYRLPADVFDDPRHNAANQCYCDVDSGSCPPRGVINVTACSMGVPAMISFPHFYRGDPKLREDIAGLSPDPALHDSHLDVHPRLGLSLNGKSSLQLNIQVKKTSIFRALDYLEEDIILPIAWIDMVVSDLPESVKSLVYHGTYSTAAMQLGLQVFCILSLLVSAVGLSLMLFCRRPKPCATIKIPVDTEMRTQLAS